MVNPFYIVSQKLAELGIFSFFLPWIITAAVFWGLLKRSKIFESELVNAILSISISFLIWGYLVLPIATQIWSYLATFIMQGLVVIIVFLVALLGASLFYPKFGEFLAESFKNRTMIWVFLAIFFGGLFFTSGLYQVLIPRGGPSGTSYDVSSMIIMLVILMIGILIVVAIQKGLGG